ncbi:MAG: hypothetical protein PHD13_01605 [Methanocellales archaeon]|nr:hypothetical protein [Methanocellales archaeon]MDD3290974.1 hypothetical protein [Methanocellales archaeon]MDD5234859.1 hypothetical protein [Methanocellales archaeon]MDD5484771.1 hypothetical protein [Methanocellales archaeon]
MCKQEEYSKDYEHAPKECTPEIKEYHGEIKVEDHPCGVKKNKR